MMVSGSRPLIPIEAALRIAEGYAIDTMDDSELLSNTMLVQMWIYGSRVRNLSPSPTHRLAPVVSVMVWELPEAEVWMLARLFVREP